MNPAEPDTNRVCLVTGGAVRVGRAIAVGLARAGFDVAFTYHSSDREAEVTRADLEALGRRVLPVRSDLRDPGAPERVVAAVRDALGPLDVLVNSAASFAERPLGGVDAGFFDRHVALNVRAPLLLARAAAADLARHGRGRVIDIHDLSADRPFPGRLVHSVTKAALAALTRGLALELGPDVQVHGVVPGAVLPPDDWSDEAVRRRVAPLPIPRTGVPEDVAEAVVYLATCSSYATGVVIHVDGGDHLVGTGS